MSSYPLGTRRCCDVESKSIQRRNNVVWPVGIVSETYVYVYVIIYTLLLHYLTI